MNIQFIGSPNYSKGRGGKPISLIVVHHMAGTLSGTDGVFQNTQINTSATYGVGRKGEVHQYVHEEDTSYNAGNFDINQRSISIEHEDLGSDNYTDIEYETSAELIRDICARYNLPIDTNTVRPHNQFSSTSCPGTLDINRLIKLAQGDSMATITREQEQVLALATTGSYPGKDYDYRFVGRSLDQSTTDEWVNFWLAQSAVPVLTTEIEVLKKQVGQTNNADPKSIVITQKGWAALGEAIRSFFSKNN